MTTGPSRKIAFVLAASDHGTLIVNRFDYRMIDETRGFGVGLDILNTSSFDPKGVDLTLSLLALRRQYFGDGVQVVDCGANIGTFTLEWARKMAGWGFVTAIEAQERIYYALAGNIAINNCFNARALLAAAGDRLGVMKIPVLDYAQPASFGSVEIKKLENPEFIGQDLDYASEHAIEVPCITLDSLELPRVDLIKIDVEGMELEVLAGAAGLIERHHPIVIAEFIKAGKEKLRAWLEAREYSLTESDINFVAIHKSDKTLGHITKAP